MVRHLIKDELRYVSFRAGAAALLYLASCGIVPMEHPFRSGEYIVETSLFAYKELRSFLSRHDVIYALSWQFAVSGVSITLAGDFNVASNQINCIGFGQQGLAGRAGTGASGGTGGGGGGGGAFAQIVNYNTHGAGDAVPCQVGGTGGGVNTWFDAVGTVFAAGAIANTSNGGTAALSTGSTTFDGGDGALGGAGSSAGGGGGGGGGAAGPDGAGGNGVAGSLGGAAGAGGTGDGGAVASGANGTQFNATHGSGGGGPGGAGGLASHAGHVGSNGGKYGAGGGGGGGGGTNGAGAAGGLYSTGIVAIGYTPPAVGTAPRGNIVIVT
jgi:hypothetical protein